jgi:hypothetical protein
MHPVQSKTCFSNIFGNFNEIWKKFLKFSSDSKFLVHYLFGFFICSIRVPSLVLTQILSLNWKNGSFWKKTSLKFIVIKFLIFFHENFLCNFLCENHTFCHKEYHTPVGQIIQLFSFFKVQVAKIIFKF